MIAGLDGTYNNDVLFPLSQHAQDTLLNIARQAPSMTLKVSPFCHENPEGTHEVRGWVLNVPSESPASALPINCSLFDGISLVECECTEAEVLSLLSQPEDTRRRLGEAMDRIMRQHQEEESRATWKRCRPTANGVPQSLYSAFMGKDNKVTLCSTQDCVATIDSETWMPEVTAEGFLGLYHHWNASKNRLCLYMVPNFFGYYECPMFEFCV